MHVIYMRCQKTTGNSWYSATLTANGM